MRSDSNACLDFLLNSGALLFTHLFIFLYPPLQKQIIVDPLSFSEDRFRPSLEERLESIISGAALMADSSCTRDDRRERIVAECNSVRQALQDLLSEYMGNVRTLLLPFYTRLHPSLLLPLHPRRGLYETPSRLRLHDAMPSLTTGAVYPIDGPSVMGVSSAMEQQSSVWRFLARRHSNVDAEWRFSSISALTGI